MHKQQLCVTLHAPSANNLYADTVLDKYTATGQEWMHLSSVMLRQHMRRSSEVNLFFKSRLLWQLIVCLVSKNTVGCNSRRISSVNPNKWLSVGSVSWLTIQRDETLKIKSDSQQEECRHLLLCCSSSVKTVETHKQMLKAVVVSRWGWRALCVCVGLQKVCYSSEV